MSKGTFSAWVIVSYRFKYPYIITDSLRYRRRESQAIVGAWYQKDGETLAQGWRRAYRMGCRCRTVICEVET